jgi:hypothetical protein
MVQNIVVARDVYAVRGELGFEGLRWREVVSVSYRLLCLVKHDSSRYV